MAGDRGNSIAEKTEKDGAYLTHMNMASEASSAHIRQGNMTDAPPEKILRQAAYERRMDARLAKEWSRDVELTMDVSAQADMTSKVVIGGVQLVCRVPLAVHMYREHFLKKYHKNRTTIHIDATGSLSKQMGSKRPYLYVIVADGGAVTGDVSYPLSHMLSESHTVPTVSNWLSRLSHHYQVVNNVPFIPPRVVIDHS